MGEFEQNPSLRERERAVEDAFLEEMDLFRVKAVEASGRFRRGP